MSNTLKAVFTVVFLVGLVASIVFLFIGIRTTTKEMKKEEGPGVIPKKILIRSTLFLIASVLCMAVSYFGMHIEDYYDGLCSMGTLIFSCLASVLRSFGWIILIPWLMNLFKKTARPDDDDKDTDKM